MLSSNKKKGGTVQLIFNSKLLKYSKNAARTTQTLFQTKNCLQSIPWNPSA
jgi:hypothetical protein